MSDSEVLRGVIRAVTIEPDGSFSWFGERSGPAARPHRPKTARRLWEDARLRLEHRLYANFYLTGKAVPMGIDDDDEDADEMQFVERLSAANCGRGVAENGWKVSSRNGTTTVTRNGITLRVPPARINRSNGRVTLRGPKEMRGMSPGFYIALGNLEVPSAPLLRVYWNIRPGGAVDFIRHITHILNRASIPFRAKVARSPLSFGRCDSAVLYAPRRDRRRLYPRLRELYRHLATELRETVPAMTKRIGRGVAIAEDPPGALSFGEHRCRALAEALIEAHRKGESRDDRVLALLRAAFERNGISPARPFLNAGSRDVYELLEP